MADALGVNLTAEEDKLIGNNPQDKLLVKIRELRLANATAGEKELLAKSREAYLRNFYLISRKRFGLNYDLLASDEFDRGMILALENLIRKKAFKWRYISIPIGILVPLWGWVSLACMAIANPCEDFANYKFIRSRNILLKLGKDPRDYLLAALGKGEDK